MSFEPLRNPVGFGIPDFLELALAALLVSGILLWPRVAPLVARLSERTRLCMAFLALTPVLLRLLLLSHHPVPSPDLYDEFGHLLVADTIRNARLANPPHQFARFFETFFVLQSPTYSAIYPIGNGALLALGWFVTGSPWGGVLMGCGLLCALVYWMLRAWVSPGWAVMGGLLAIFLFGPLNQWTNNYWGGALPAAAGCLIFGALPRLKAHARRQDSIALGAGLAIHLLTRPYETVFIGIAVAAYLLISRVALKSLLPAALIVLVGLGITAVHNKSVTGGWTTLPYALSQFQYGVPAALTFQSDPVPHRELTREQQLDYQMQSGFLAGKETVKTFAERLIFRTRYYRFYFFAPMYIAVASFLIFAFRKHVIEWLWVIAACVLMAIGVNFFPAFQFHYLAGVVCLFLLITVKGLEQLASRKHGGLAARFLIGLAVAQFSWAYAVHFADQGGYDLWTSINHTNPERRIEVNRDLAKIPGRLLVFVRYWPSHPFQEEWVYNGADIDTQRIVWARDLGDAENQKLIAYYGDREPLLLEPDARPPALEAWSPAPAPEPEKRAPPPSTGKKPLLELEQVR